MQAELQQSSSTLQATPVAAQEQAPLSHRPLQQASSLRHPVPGARQTHVPDTQLRLQQSSFSVQADPLSQQTSQMPPQPSLPHVLPLQSGVQQMPLKQTSPAWQVPGVQPQCPLTQRPLQQSPSVRQAASAAPQRQAPLTQAPLQHSSSLPQATLAALQVQAPLAHKPLQQPRS